MFCLDFKDGGRLYIKCNDETYAVMSFTLSDGEKCTVNIHSRPEMVFETESRSLAKALEEKKKQERVGRTNRLMRRNK